MDSLASADAMAELDSFPISDSLIVDSIQALVEGDYRRALLFSTIAMESYVSARLEKLYNEKLESDIVSPHLRVSCFILSSGKVQKKDPVFSYLMEKSKSEFAPLLNEIPMYLFGKSLLLDDQRLYQKAILLYKTRNQIVHRGEINENDKNLLLLNYSDAKA